MGPPILCLRFLMSHVKLRKFSWFTLCQNIPFYQMNQVTVPYFHRTGYFDFDRAQIIRIPVGVPYIYVFFITQARFTSFAIFDEFVRNTTKFDSNHNFCIQIGWIVESLFSSQIRQCLKDIDSLMTPSLCDRLVKCITVELCCSCIFRPADSRAIHVCNCWNHSFTFSICFTILIIFFYFFCHFMRNNIVFRIWSKRARTAVSHLRWHRFACAHFCCPTPSSVW